MGEGTIDNPAAAGGAGRHIYVHIPFCARICPYCAFYKERADPKQVARFCEAILGEVVAGGGDPGQSESAGPVDQPGSTPPATTSRLAPWTIFFGGGTPTALTTTRN